MEISTAIVGIVQPYDWVIHDGVGDDAKMVIHCWALDRESRPVLLRLTDFPVFCYLELPMFVGGQVREWHRDLVDQVMAMLGRVCGPNAPVNYSFITSNRKLYYYRAGRTTPMIYVSFNTLRAMAICRSKIANALRVDDLGFVKLTMLEDDVDMVRKLLTVRDVTHAQWMRFTASPTLADDRVSSIEREYSLSWRNIDGISETESEGWTTQPGILSFDIECYSNNHRAMPDMLNPAHVVYMVSGVYRRLNQPSSTRRYCILMGDCSKVENLECFKLIKVSTELELARALADVIQETDPEIVTGYNILTFDCPYLDFRVTRKLDTWPVMGRIIGVASYCVTNSWYSEAYSYNSSCTIVMEGRISVDLLPTVKKGYKLDNYKLETVAQHFLGRGKNDITPKQMFEIYESNLRIPTSEPALAQRALDDMARVVAYCVKDAELVLDLIDRLDLWIDMIELSNVAGVAPVKLAGGQQQRCFSLLYDIASRNNVVLDTVNMSYQEYDGAVVYDPIPGLHDNVLIIDFGSLYPSIIEAYNMCYTTLIKPDMVRDVPASQCNAVDIEGSEIAPPNPDKLLSDTSRKKKAPKRVIKPQTHRYSTEYKGLIPQLVKRLVTKRRAVRALIPQRKELAIKALLNQRQNALKVCANSIYGFFGVKIGGKRPCFEIAASVTAMGRKLIGTVSQYIRDVYGGRIIYGDTDSCMVDLGITDPSKCYEWGERLSQEISGIKVGDPIPGSPGQFHLTAKAGLFPPPLGMEFETAARLFCLTKKRYAGIKIGRDGAFLLKRDAKSSIDYELLIKGLTLVRRDGNAFLRKLYFDVLSLVLQKAPLEAVMRVLVPAVVNLLTGQIDYKDLIMVRGVGANYVLPNYPMNVFITRLRREGKIIEAGERIEFLVADDPTAAGLGQRMITIEEYLEMCDSHVDPTPSLDQHSLPAPLPRRSRLDLNYYAVNVTAGTVDQLINVAYGDVLARLSSVIRLTIGRRKPLGLNRPVFFLSRMAKLSFDLSSVDDLIYSVVTGT
jgi:DNA polymerase delta subunit 1